MDVNIHKGFSRRSKIRDKKRLVRALKPIAFNNKHEDWKLAPQDIKVKNDLMEVKKDPSAIGKLGKFPNMWELNTSRGGYMDHVQKWDTAALKMGEMGHGCPKNGTFRVNPHLRQMYVKFPHCFLIMRKTIIIPL
jgi:hypothetical protein